MLVHTLTPPGEMFAFFHWAPLYIVWMKAWAHNIDCHYGNNYCCEWTLKQKSAQIQFKLRLPSEMHFFSFRMLLEQHRKFKDRSFL